MSLADNIRRLREQKRLSQSELAEKAGVTQPAIDYFEKGKRIPNGFTLVEIAKSLDTTAEELVSE